MADHPTKIYVCFEPHYQGCADRLDAWSHTNYDEAAYAARMGVPVESEAADPFKRALGAQIRAAAVTVCLISQTTCLDAWIAWELETSKSGPDRNGLVGAVLHEYDPHPPAMVDSGASSCPSDRPPSNGPSNGP